MDSIRAAARAAKATTEAAEPVVAPKAKATHKAFNGASLGGEIDSLLKLTTWESDERLWLNTGSEELNGLLGSRELGLPYGKMTELAGVKHGGKTTLTTIIAGMAQKDGAGCGRIDVENSRDPVWERALGMDPDSIISIYPRMIDPSCYKPKSKEDLKKHPRPLFSYPEGAETMFLRAEAGMALLKAKGFKKQYWWVDSIANLQTEMSVLAGPAGQNMRTAQDRAQFLSQMLPRWASLAANYNAMIIFINQIRTRPGVMFGDPRYTPGGNALQHNCAVQAWVHRIKNGQLKKGDRVIGLVGWGQNIKNKAGGGSKQSLTCGYKVKWSKSPATWEFMSKEDAEALVKA